MNRTAMARRLRRDQTDAERLLWSVLRGRRLEGFKFRRQVPIDRYVADFVCVEARLIVELDGGQHASDEGRAYDAARTRALEACGYVVLRFWNDAVRYELDGVGDEILSVLRAARP
ncbi:endonuclease [Caulobacter flavus]|uniref:Endonuclease n=1 Tax=Caulobacter flavus TaxID=1679497 RepID=A0A2N5CLP9_9CAUL|nr:endonuclease domain-containing protein [Caulobacter flavus]AYV48823.1 endonuclease [Caulobacter flavus]PLR06719.1 endonuclease [Caulobacter flavus]